MKTAFVLILAVMLSGFAAFADPITFDAPDGWEVYESGEDEVGTYWRLRHPDGEAAGNIKMTVALPLRSDPWDDSKRYTWNTVNDVMFAVKEQYDAKMFRDFSTFSFDGPTPLEGVTFLSEIKFDDRTRRKQIYQLILEPGRRLILLVDPPEFDEDPAFDGLLKSIEITR